jgi:hypothetical protein
MTTSERAGVRILSEHLPGDRFTGACDMLGIVLDSKVRLQSFNELHESIVVY